MIKCDMCYDRLAKNQLPACVEACPQGVLEFGDRDNLLKAAKKRIREYPGKYINHIWGEKEFGGTSVMYISDVDLASIGWPEYEPEAIPRLTEPLIHKTPFIGLSVGLSLVGINWIIRRRMKLADEKNGIITNENSDGETDNGK